MSAPLISLSDLQLAFGHHPLLDHAALSITQGERIGLIGRNGAGKSSLLKILQGTLQPDDGEVQRAGGLRVAAVDQEPELEAGRSVMDILCGDLNAHEDWRRPARAQQLIDSLGLSGEDAVDALSGGSRKRVALARALVEEPDLLLLDEPTNHLDFDGIAWLERSLLASRCSVVLITHDRRFLDTVATRIIELDRGQLFSFPGNFSSWQQRKAEWLAAEQQQNARFDKLLAQEEVWIRKGIEARRTRNEGRVRRLEQLRRERAARREQQGNVRLAIAEGQRSGKLVAELTGVHHAWGDKRIATGLDLTIMRQDRIGLIGPNGAGKTTLLKIILGELAPDQGTVRHGTHLTVGYFDQMRERLDENATLADTINPGSEWVEIGSQRKHVMSYLEDFLFPPARAHAPVSTLSGGERARLALARLFARPTNVLVLDEPTNDLDIETLELLETLLLDYTGTVLLVSHDRAFLDNVATQTLASEGDGIWRENVGGYADWEASRPAAASAGAGRGPRADADGPGPEGGQGAAESPSPAAPRQAGPRQAGRPGRLAPWEKDELAGLPERIAAVEAEQAELAAQLADPDLYRDGPEQARQVESRLSELDTQLETLFERWAALEAKSDAS